MSKYISLFLSLIFSSFLFADGHGMPKSGTFDFHTGWKCSVNVKTLGENHMQGAGDCTGVTFNDAGKGALHNGGGTCFVTFEVKDNVGYNSGVCNWSDQSGDMLYTSFTGNGVEGTNTITGGTGKYAGITGSGPWKCTDVGKAGENFCNQSLTYQLP